MLIVLFTDSKCRDMGYRATPMGIVGKNIKWLDLPEVGHNINGYCEAVLELHVSNFVSSLNRQRTARVNLLST